LAAFEGGAEKICCSASDPVADFRNIFHSAAMKAAFVSLALVSTAACHAENDDHRVGWHYRSPSKEVPARLDYVFSDPEIRLIGYCNNGPNFILFGGDYLDGARTFTLIVDGISRQLPASEHAHGRFLSIEDTEIAADTLRAKRLITFRVGDWERRIPANPLLEQFAHACS
jgi:hypothetical protein